MIAVTVLNLLLVVFCHSICQLTFTVNCIWIFISLLGTALSVTSSSCSGSTSAEWLYDTWFEHLQLEAAYSHATSLAFNELQLQRMRAATPPRLLPMNCSCRGCVQPPHLLSMKCRCRGCVQPPHLFSMKCRCWGCVQPPHLFSMKCSCRGCV